MVRALTSTAAGLGSISDSSKSSKSRSYLASQAARQKKKKKKSQAGTMPYSQWNLRLGHFICQIRKPGLWSGASLVVQWLRLCTSPEGFSSPD